MLRLKILVVEDEITIAGNLVSFLELHGHAADVAYDGPAAITRLSSETYDAVVLDLGLPRKDGFQVLEQMRRTLMLATPVLILSARSELDSRLQGFAEGADDFLAKPFALAEVEARILALHRRATGATVMHDTRLGSLRLDRRKRSAFVNEVAIHLMPRSMTLLERLMRDPGVVVPRRELERLLWPDEDCPPDALRGQVYLLRRTLSEAGFDGLETVHGVGFRLKA